VKTAEGYGWQWDGNLDFDVSILKDDPFALSLMMNASPDLKAAMMGWNEGRIAHEDMSEDVAS
jgi:hypothetical protein